MGALIGIIAALGGGSLVAMIQAVANRRAVGAHAQKDLASGYGEFTDDLRQELKETKATLKDLQTREGLLYYYAADMLRHIGQVHQLAATSTGKLDLPAPPPVPAGLTFP